ncbi:TIGR03758 family integrating conjugative element protein [Yersinia enterocolitica]|uniref:TIGR03758 family integrating conjugative element protein n=1 Tax=Yersinia bercovieri TaxID=634 RepID=UPI0011AB7E5B|nr:TIGR03758 family integrating conjugative element protein [Yersinia bercovieri]EKN3342818.1 TIGR03758 family integrating conjugative element protein [Yersinia enterocolitica]EKN5021385.1 TIGR03758 family integrating conjugative element protein [Yersinia enterocolitica]EKN5065958.1 TIGR03758 family integrating conjugative element protein [Yersinia enterocolitica]EKN5131647.1 TIGR03758 family integrating conjugative element protein [Yersinia enterocolitica]HDL6991979.1 TIGR03758 family integra
MNEAQTAAFKAAASNVDPSVLNLLFISSLISLLTLWAGWGFVHVYRGYAAGNIKGSAVQRFVVRVVILLLVSLYLFAS